MNNIIFCENEKDLNFCAKIGSETIKVSFFHFLAHKKC